MSDVSETGQGARSRATPEAPARPLVRIVDLHKRFGALEVLKGVSLEVARGEVVAIIGPSGSGKTTLLRCVYFLERPTSGEIYVDGQRIGLSINAGLRELYLSDYATTPPGWEGLTADLRVFQFHLGLGHVTPPLPEVHTLRVGRFVREDGAAFNSLPKLASLTTWGGEWPALCDRRQRPLAELRAYFPKVPRKVEPYFRQQWVDGVRILEPRGGPEQVQAALKSPRLTGLRQLYFRPGDYPWLTAHLDDVVWWPSVTTFDAGHQRLVFSKRDWLASGLCAPNLKHLNLSATPLGDDGAVALAQNPSLANLTRLNVSACRIGAKGVEALLNSPHLQRLIELNLYANNGGEALRPLADASVMPNLGLADVAANGVSDELRARLEQRPAIRAR